MREGRVLQGQGCYGVEEPPLCSDNPTLPRRPLRPRRVRRHHVRRARLRRPQQYDVGMRAHAANAGVQEGGSKALAIICFGEDAAAKARKQAAADGGAISAVVGGMRAHAANAGVQENGSMALRNICLGVDAAKKARKQAEAGSVARLSSSFVDA